MLTVFALILHAGESPRKLDAYRGLTPVLDGQLSAGEWDDARRQIALGLMEVRGGQAPPPSGKQFLLAADGAAELPLGGTAAGTGLNAGPGFASAVIARRVVALRTSIGRAIWPRALRSPRLK